MNARAASLENARPSCTDFNFEHRVFRLPAAYFAATPDTGEPAYFVKLGDLQATLSLNTLCSGFGIADGTADHQLLGLVRKGLQFVREIRPGDSIPSELLDGSASWKVEQHHIDLAKGRLSAQLIAWITGEESSTIDGKKLIELSNNPEMKERVQSAISAVAEKMGLGAERRQEVVDMVDGLARELSYIEALRERAGEVNTVARRVSELSGAARGDATLREMLVRVAALIRTPISDFKAILDQVDAQTGEIMSVLRKFDHQVKFIRSTRDSLHCKLSMWDPIFKEWVGPGTPSLDNLENATRVLYAFLARNYPQTSRWSSRG